MSTIDTVFKDISIFRSGEGPARFAIDLSGAALETSGSRSSSPLSSRSVTSQIKKAVLEKLSSVSNENASSRSKVDVAQITLQDLQTALSSLHNDLQKVFRELTKEPKSVRKGKKKSSSAGKGKKENKYLTSQASRNETQTETTFKDSALQTVAYAVSRISQWTEAFIKSKPELERLIGLQPTEDREKTDQAALHQVYTDLKAMHGLAGDSTSIRYETGFTNLELNMNILSTLPNTGERSTTKREGVTVLFEQGSSSAPDQAFEQQTGSDTDHDDEVTEAAAYKQLEEKYKRGYRQDGAKMSTRTLSILSQLAEKGLAELDDPR